MARQKSEPPAKQPASLSPQQLQTGIERLKRKLEEVEALDSHTITEWSHMPHIKKIEASVEDGLIRTFGVNSLEYERFKSAHDLEYQTSIIIAGRPPALGNVQASVRRNKNDAGFRYAEKHFLASGLCRTWP